VGGKSNKTGFVNERGWGGGKGKVKITGESKEI